MTPVVCQVKHDPENGSYGDCLRACIASMLDLKAEDVPHFMRDNPPDETLTKRVREFLAPMGLGLFLTAYDSSYDLQDVLRVMQNNNPGIHYFLIHDNGQGDHMVVCKDDKVVHNPAWCATGIYKPSSAQGVWITGALVRL